jgi:acyl-CoA synthetase (AMP-forming)/AMP-acid ligase II
MMVIRALHQLLDVSASRFPDNIAVEESESGSIRYRDLARLSDRVRDRLLQLRVEPGDRVGICMRKSGDAVASIFGIMKAGAA